MLTYHTYPLCLLPLRMTRNRCRHPVACVVTSRTTAVDFEMCEHSHTSDMALMILSPSAFFGLSYCAVVRAKPASNAACWHVVMASSRVANSISGFGYAACVVLAHFSSYSRF